MDQSHNQSDMNRAGQGGMNHGGSNQGMMGMQQQMAAAAMRDSQLQLVSNLIQQQGGMSSSLMGGPNQGGMMSGGNGMGGGAGLLGMGGMGMNEMGRNSERRNSGGNSIPSLFDINTKKTGLLGKRGNNNNRERESRFSNNQNNNKRMRQNSQGQSPRGFHQNRQGQQYRQSRWSDRSPTRAGGVRPRERDFRRPSSRDSKYSDRSPNSRTSRDRRESGSSRKDESEEYDPAQPTEEDDELDVPPLESDPEDVLIPEVTVQLNHDDKQSKDEDVDESMEEDSKSPGMAEGGDSSLTITLSGSGRSVNDANTEKTEDTTPTKKSSYYCHACGVECRTEEGFAKHMNGKKHKVRMESLLTLHQEKSKQFEARIKAEEHLRKIEGKPRHERRSSGGEGGRYHNLPGRYSRDTSRYDLWPRCNVCSQMFKSPEKFIRHLKTPHHLENLRDRARKSSREEEEDNGFPDFGDMVTVDTIGFEDDYLSQDKSDEEQEGLDRDQTEYPEKADKIDIDHSKQVYDPDVAVGQKFIVPVSGFFCKLCHRFYNSESAARVSHCQSESHFKNFQKAMLTKALNKKNKKANTTDPAKQKPNESVENLEKSDNQENQSKSGQEVMDIPDCPKGQIEKSKITQSNGDISSVSQSDDSVMKPKAEIDNVAEIDPDTEVKLLERTSEAGSPDVPDEDSLLEEEEEMEEAMEAESEEPKSEPVNTKPSQRGRGGTRGRTRRGRRGKN
ncbi:RNA-binding protein 20-like isoform X2 [Pecten maximus]|uniref:RNA-binding protein 20-like isoform X2 n=1 Tax=Pecten maximus TaxID=6579 RepID=UPI001458089F|nr:RNA-binding protein 20-like isoform X2 [Pecten maximus]